VEGAWVQRIVLCLVAGIAALALDVPAGLAGNCWEGWCFVAVPGADPATAATRGVLDNYWRDRPVATASAAARGNLDSYWRDARNATRSDSTAGGSRETLLARARGAFSWGSFGIGIGVALGALLALVAVAGALGFRVSRDGAAWARATPH
jgi:hypothetical protein